MSIPNGEKYIDGITASSIKLILCFLGIQKNTPHSHLTFS